MDSLQNNAPSEMNPAFSAGLEAGLLGAVLILIEQVLQNFIKIPTLELILGLVRVAIWIGIGALAVYWLKGKGSIERPDQTKVGLIAGLITGLATAILLIVFGYFESKTVGEIPIPEGFPVDMQDQFRSIYTTENINLVIGISLFCCKGIPTLIFATAFSYGGSVLMRMFFGSSQQPSLKGQVPFKDYSRERVRQQALPQEELLPRRLEDFLSVEGLPIELHTSVAAYKRGELVNARPAFVRFLRLNPKHAYSWLWLSVMVDEPDRQLECVKRALALEPGNETAQKMLAFLEKSSPHG